jgi:hypothetical protein
LDPVRSTLSVDRTTLAPESDSALVTVVLMDADGCYVDPQEPVVVRFGFLYDELDPEQRTLEPPQLTLTTKEGGTYTAKLTWPSAFSNVSGFQLSAIVGDAHLASSVYVGRA